MQIQIIPSGNGTTTIPTTAVATSNITSETLTLDGKHIRVGTLSMCAITTGFNAADATVRLQHSPDGTNFANLDSTDSTVGLLTIASGSNTTVLTPVTFLAMGFYRAVYTKNSNSAGTIQVIFNLF